MLGLVVCWWCLVVLVCVSICQYVLVCVVFVVLLVASVLASMRWLLCGGDGSKKNDIYNYRKKSSERIYLHYGFNYFEKIDPHQITNITDLINSKNN